MSSGILLPSSRCNETNLLDSVHDRYATVSLELITFTEPSVSCCVDPVITVR